MLNSIIPLVLAASLSTSELGTFFDLPDWMPREVSSHDTPGSDPQDGTGWYVTGEAQIETARVTRTTHFSPIERSYSYYNWETGEEMNTNGIVTSKVSQPTWDKNKRAWNVAGSILLEDRGTDEPEYVYGYDETPYILSWSWQDPSGYKYFSYAAKTYRTKEDRYYKTVQGTIPRSFRLTPGILAAFNSTFEAYFERMYFSSAGKSNVWNVAHYGPRDIRHFDFSKNRLYGRGHTIEPVAYPFYFNPTSRVINTRRLVDYNNFDRLTKWMLEFDRIDLFAGRITMDSWRGAWEDQYDWNVEWLITPHWSTTAPAWDDYGFFDFNWTPNPFRAIDWSKVAVTFGSIINTYHGGTSPWDDSYDDPYWFWNGLNLPVVGCLDHIFNGSKSGYQKSNIRSAVADSQFHKEYQKVFPHADSGNSLDWQKTRRRSSKGIATLNQVLGIMDRTYRNVNLGDYGEVSNYTGVARISDKAYVNASIVGDAQGIRLESPILPDNVEWIGATVTNKYSANGSYRQYRISSNFSGTFSSSSPVLLSDATIGTIIVDDAMISDIIINAGMEDDAQITITIFKPTLSQDGLTATSQIMIGNDWNAFPSNSSSIVMWTFDTVNNTFLVSVYTDRRYDYGETFIPSVEFDGLQTPCNLARSSGRVKDEEVFAISSIFSVDYDMSWREYPSYFNGADRYNWAEWFSAKTYSSNLDYAIRVDEPSRILAYERERLRNHLGTNPEDVETIVPVDNGHCLKIAKDNFSFSQASSVKVVSDFRNITLFINNSDSSIPLIERGRAYYDNGVLQGFQDGPYDEISTLPYTFAIVQAQFDNADPQSGCTYDEIDPYSQFGNSSYIHKIDWNWKALHRTDD